MLQPDIKKYDFIDALRGLAILGVVLTHSSQRVAATNAMFQWFMSEGARGVQLFYVASALTLCMSWMARSPHDTFPIRNFFIRRFFRIAPMFYVGILLYIFLNGFSPTYWAPNGIKWWFVPTTAAFLHGLNPETINSLVPGGWSIAVEMSFYLILPFLLVYVKSIRACLFLFILSLLLYGLNRLIIPHMFIYPENQQYIVSDFHSLNLFGQLPVFSLGILCYLILRNNYPRKQIGIVGGLLLVVFLLLLRYPVPKVPQHIIAGVLFLVFALLLANWPTRLLVNPITIILGKLSYSIYLLHYAVSIFFSRLGFDGLFGQSNLASCLYFFCVILGTVFVSFFSHRYIEKPGIAMGKRLIEQGVARHSNTRGKRLAFARQGSDHPTRF
jgi:peptidoglycan/LPS O-acetylase OafA/YrhL